MASLIAEPELPYSELASRLRTLGWQWRSEAQSLPLLPGEPEHVVWGHAETETRLVYTLNPAVMLRVLSFAGPHAEGQRARAAAFVPHLAPDAVGELICAREAEACVLGMLAARELGLGAMLPLILARQEDEDELIARVASDVAAELPRAAAGQAKEQLRRALAGLSEASAAFSLLGDAALRRQVLRHAAATLRGDQLGGLHFLLQAALVDPDWELRVSALLLAGRQRLRAARDAIAALELPRDDRFGHGPRDRERLELLRRVVLDVLGGAGEPSEPLARHVFRCVLEGQSDRFDGVFLLVHALTTPLDLTLRPEPALPAHVRATELGFALARSGLPVVRVAPVASWLGDPDAPGNGSGLRRVVPSSGFFITTRPLSRAVVRWLRAGAAGPAGTARGDDAQDFAATYDEACALAAALSKLEGVALEPASPDQWELAVRGPDGRRHPWGNGLEANAGRRASPWGVVGACAGAAEWVRAADEPRLACGGPGLRCSERSTPDASAQLAVRLIVR